jgi:hypothetical protein
MSHRLKSTNQHNQPTKNHFETGITIIKTKNAEEKEQKYKWWKPILWNIKTQIIKTNNKGNKQSREIEKKTNIKKETQAIKTTILGITMVDKKK